VTREVKREKIFAVAVGVKRGVTLEPRRACAFKVVDPTTGEVLDRKNLRRGSGSR
jgi:hypothetical protein